MRTDRGWKRFYATGWFVSALIGAAAIHQWHEHMRAIEGRLSEAERTRQAVVQRVAAEERLRIARELHDSLTHSISVVKVQAGVAVHLLRKSDEDVPEALLAIQEAAGDATRELRETLGVLRRDAGGGCAGLHGMADLPSLVEQARGRGLQADLAVVGTARGVPCEVDAAAYRIVQEALTNVGRHAGDGARAHARVRYRHDSVVVQVDDDGAGHLGEAPGSGLGLIGMRERVVALGGSLAAQGRPGGGFTVRAELPAVQLDEP